MSTTNTPPAQRAGSADAPFAKCPTCGYEGFEARRMMLNSFDRLCLVRCANTSCGVAVGIVRDIEIMSDSPPERA